jgi:hypothetical protein
MNHWFKNARSVVLSLFIGLILCGCKSTPPQPAAHPITGSSATVHGYALLYDLLGDEQNVSKLLIIKRERAQFRDLIKHISQTCGDGHKQLEKFGKTDPSLNLKDRGLPAAEVTTREAISKTRARELLTEKGKDFELGLLLTQNEALVYASHLAAVLHAEEKNPERADYLQRLTEQLVRLQTRIVAMLLENHSWQPDKPR